MSRLKGRPVLNKRRAARFAAVQALYQIELMGAPAGRGLPRVRATIGSAACSSRSRPTSPRPRSTANGSRSWSGAPGPRTTAWIAEIDAVPRRRLDLRPLGYLLRACLRAGAFELAERTDVPVKVVINEYVELAYLFFDAGEPAFVNAVLDRLAPQLRATESAP